jgi:hypothetical protein
MALSKMCLSAPVLLKRRGLNLCDRLPESTASAEEENSLVLWKNPADLGFQKETNSLLLRLEEVTVALMDDLDASVVVTFGDANKKTGRLLTCTWPATEMVMMLAVITGERGDLVQVFRPCERENDFRVCDENVENLCIILRDSDSGELINAEVSAKIMCQSRLNNI